MDQLDVVVIGGGIAGASAAWALAGSGRRVALVEQEPQPGLHATGRSAATLSETSGARAVCALAAASRPFLADPPDGFADHPLLAPRGLLWIGRDGDGPLLDALAAHGRTINPSVRRLDPAEVMSVLPMLREDAVGAGGVDEPEAMAIDVAGLLAGYLRGLRRAGGTTYVSNEAVELSRDAQGWTVVGSSATLRAPVVVNAAGAWGDVVAERAGVPPIGLKPLRRTACLVPAPDEVRDWPLVMDIASRCYFEPEAGGLLLSPADETLDAPCDARAEELDVALALDRLRETTKLTVRSVRRAWAGLRTFSADGVPIAGFDPDAPGFFWLVGQAGAGIKTAPALATITVALVAGERLPASVAAAGVGFDELAPARFRPASHPDL
ncbi:MAG: NAD(P)/FAD-dependent oxidoreductase [Acidimicrobiia bacterium]